MSQFTFLQTEFPTIYESAHKTFKTAYRDPRTACFYARRALELYVRKLNVAFRKSCRNCF